jgi:hypothetical protein
MNLNLMPKFYQMIFYRTLCLIPLAISMASCSKVTELKVAVTDTVKPNILTKVTIVRTGSGSGEWDIGDKDGFNYYFSSYPAGNFKVTEIEGKENDYCRTTESNEVTDGKMHNEVEREMLVKEKGRGEITIAIACHKRMYRFFAADSIVNIQMVIEDADDKVMDTVVFKIVRTPSPKRDGDSI